MCMLVKISDSYLSDVATGVICGFGAQGYTFALEAADKYLNKGN